MSPSTSSPLPPGFGARALASLQRLRDKSSSFELVHTPHDCWPRRPGHPADPSLPLRIPILDSSFNPPTLSHLAIITSLPCGDHDARLLLLSVSNADKSLQPGDASHLQRLEMMYFLSRSVSSCATSSPPPEVGDNVALALIDEPTFVGKAAVLRSFFQTRLPSPRHPELTFLLGTDTLVRLFSPKYYASEEAMMQLLRNFLSPCGENCRIVCARRPSAFTDPAPQRDLQSALEIAHEFILPGRIYMIDIGPDEEPYSSSLTRAQVAGGGDHRRFVTDAVADYIIEHGLYASQRAIQN